MEESDDVEALLARPQGSTKASVEAWGAAFVGHKVLIPAAVWGPEYARDAKRLWALEQAGCAVTKFTPGAAGNGDKKGGAAAGHRWTFDWVDPDETTQGTLDQKHLAAYLVAWKRHEIAANARPSRSNSRAGKHL